MSGLFPSTGHAVRPLPGWAPSHYWANNVPNANTPAKARGQSRLDTRQRSINIGDVVPIVFGRRVSDAGGVFVSPGASAGRFSNDATTNELSVKLRLVLSEGELDQLQNRDVFQRACRVGTWNQTYENKASNWTPGNFVTIVSGKTPWNCPEYCGNEGSYDNITTLSYENTFDDGDNAWDKQVHVFVRGGMHVTRILDDVTGPSNNFVDLALYLINQSSRIPSDLLDLVAMEDAAQFCETNGFYYNGVFDRPSNLDTWLEDTASSFLLRVSDKNGKKGFRPRIPHNADGSINTSAITPVYVFDEQYITPDGFTINYIPLENRKPHCLQMLWLEQPTDNIGFARTLDVRITGTAPDGPYEQYDISDFCVYEDHAAKLGAYRVAFRHYVTHTLRLVLRPETFNSTLELGDVVRVRLRRETAVGAVSYHDYLYEVDRIDKQATGEVTLELTHFPIDSQGRSLLALAVNAATGNGESVDPGRENYDCDDSGRASDTSNVGTIYSAATTGLGGDGTDVTVAAEASPTGDATGNSEYPDPGAGLSLSGSATAGGSLGATPPCPGGRVTWYRRPKSCNPGECLEFIKSETSSGTSTSFASITTADIDYVLEAYWSCPDPGSDDGFGPPTPYTPSDPVRPDTSAYNYARWVGTTYDTSGSNTISTASDWYSYSSYLTIGPMSGCALIPIYIEDDGDTFYGPSIGPVPWRASVFAVQIKPCGGGNLRLGGIGSDANPGPCDTSTPSRSFGCSAEPKTVGIVGSWEFSNDGSTPLISWDGDETASQPSPPENTDPRDE